MELERKIDEKRLSYEERTIQMKVKNAVAMSLSATTIAGIVIGSAAVSPRLLVGAVLGLSVTYGFQNRQNRRWKKETEIIKTALIV